MGLNSKVQVPLPPKGIIVAKGGKYPYVYRVIETYRNDKGQPTNNKRSIGKLDKDSGKLIPNNTYYEFYGDKPAESIETADEIREAGIPFLTYWIFSSLGVDGMLEESLGRSKAGMAKIIAAYMLSEGNVMSYLEEFCERSLCKGSVSGQSASQLFASIGNIERMNFFRKWASRICQSEYLAYDVTSFSSYAKGITDTEWGYNRDGERLPQINMGLYVGQTSLLPVFYVTYPGSIVDKSHLTVMMGNNSELGITNVRFVMDKGFASTRNIQHMCERSYRFIVAVENRSKAFKNAIEEYKDEVGKSRNRIDKLKIFGGGIKGRFYGAVTTLHIYYDPVRAAEQIADMYRKIASEEEELTQIGQITETQIKKYSKHFLIEVEKGGKSFSYKRNHDAIDRFASDLGYFCILTNDSLSSEEVLSIYRKKDIIEKTFDEIKNHIDMKRLRTHNQNTTEGKIFCAFLSLIVRMRMEKALSVWMGKHYYSVEKVLKELSKIRCVTISGDRRLLNPITKTQREILAAFNATPEDVLAYVVP